MNTGYNTIARVEQPLTRTLVPAFSPDYVQVPLFNRTAESPSTAP